MLTYELKKQPGLPLYESLYRAIRADILSGKLSPGEKLPSKRALAQNLEVSKITVEAAYDQLLSEGYLRSQEKVGYFVEAVTRPVPAKVPPVHAAPPAEASAETERFPFSVWSKLQREVVLDYGEKLLLPMPNTGIPELRAAIARHLGDFRGMTVDPEDILVGAGTDFLYNIRNYGALLVILFIGATPFAKNTFNKLREKGEWLVPVLCMIGLIISTAYLVDASYNPFLYFRF